MAKKKNKKKSSGPPLPLVRLSQCMIVKDEEKNIEKALGWAKDIAVEQIVVDTGSTDRTMETAERMGAKVFNFEWVDDFSAAKNFAIKQATGNWIAFLDADEYFSEKDAKTLMLFLKQIQSDPIKRESFPALGCALVNVDDAGKRTSISSQLRVFRNLPQIRYLGRIHEKLNVDAKKTLILDGIEIIHTGYSKSAMAEKKKTKRNAELLRVELSKNPDDLNIKAYLADVLRFSDDDDIKAEAEQLFKEVIDSGVGSKVHKELKHKAFIYFAKKYTDDRTKLFECEAVCKRALEEFPENLDFNYYLAVVKSNKGEHTAAYDILKQCQAKLTDENAINESLYISANPALIKEQMDIAKLSAAAQSKVAPPNNIQPSDTQQNIQQPDIPKNTVKLSLCTIVKNEEKNISALLDSVKDITFEQIVVDTGSTDKTVEIAEKAGASMYSFKWINDFAAAKNYAIEQAKGDWILALDADEYFLPEDADKLIEFLKKMQAEHEKWKETPAISFMLINLDDNKRAMTKSSIIRVFRNKPSIRYKGRVHEQLTIDIDKVVHLDYINMMHTGYSQSAHKETGKGKRNIELLRSELTSSPDDLMLKAYLANSLSMSSDEKDQSEVESLFEEIEGSGARKSVQGILRVKLYIHMISKYMSNPKRLPECESICRRAQAEFPGAIDFEYFTAVAVSRKGDNDKAWELLKDCEYNLINNNDSGDSIMIPADPTILFCQMILVAKALDDIESVVLYSTHVLSFDKNRLSVLEPCIATLLHYGVSEDETMELLSNIYDFRNKRDLQIVADAATACGAASFAERIKNRFCD
jgi:glycosyltransferase involved in cell wall biosynthesis